MTAQEQASRPRIKVVVADDARNFLVRAKAFFPVHEFEVYLAQNGCEAFNLIKEAGADIAFLDLFMPQLNGEECCRLIKSDLQLRRLPVVLVAPCDPQQISRCQEACCDLVLTKPVHRRDFLHAVQTLRGSLSRIPARWPVRAAAVLYDGSCPPQQLQTVNLSEYGAFLESTAMPSPGRCYRLRLQLPGAHPLDMAVKIAWFNVPDAPRNPSLPPGFGVQFLALSGADRQVLRRVLEEAAEAEGDSQHGARGTSSLFVELPLLIGKEVH